MYAYAYVMMDECSWGLNTAAILSIKNYTLIIIHEGVCSGNIGRTHVYVIQSYIEMQVLKHQAYIREYHIYVNISSTCTWIAYIREYIKHTHTRISYIREQIKHIYVNMSLLQSLSKRSSRWTVLQAHAYIHTCMCISMQSARIDAPPGKATHEMLHTSIYKFVHAHDCLTA